MFSLQNCLQSIHSKLPPPTQDNYNFKPAFMVDQLFQTEPTQTMCNPPSASKISCRQIAGVIHGKHNKTTILTKFGKYRTVPSLSVELELLRVFLDVALLCEMLPSTDHPSIPQPLNSRQKCSSFLFLCL